MTMSVLHLCACLQVLQEFCSLAIASKATALEADIKQLQGLSDSESTDRLKLALQFRIAVKQLLHTCAWQYDPSQAQAVPI